MTGRAPGRPWAAAGGVPPLVAGVAGGGLHPARRCRSGRASDAADRTGGARPGDSARAGPLLLVVDPETNPPTLSAYDAAAPHRPPRWRVTVPPASGWSAEAAGDLLLLAERDPARGRG
ncbi:hypothetical protein NKG94_09075 [Micromonospora sp. M12]